MLSQNNYTSLLDAVGIRLPLARLLAAQSRCRGLITVKHLFKRNKNVMTSSFASFPLLRTDVLRWDAHSVGPSECVSDPHGRERYEVNACHCRTSGPGMPLMPQIV
jgi:hypothetical protein